MGQKKGKQPRNQNKRSGPQQSGDWLSYIAGVGPKPKQRRDAKGQDSRKVHDTKGKNNHGRSF